MKSPKVIGPTITTGTSNIEVGGSGIRMEAPITGSILGVFIMAERAGVQTAAESNLIQVTLSSDSVPISPCELLAEPINSGVGADIAGYREKAPFYPLNCPVKAGNKIKVEAKELHACTVHVYVAVTFIFTDRPLAPQYKYKVGTLTAAITAGSTGEKKGSQIALQGCRMITGLYGIIVDTTIASGKGQIGKFRLSSSQIKAMGDLEWHAEFVGGILAGAAGEGCARISRLEGLEVPVADPCTLDDYFNQTVAVTTAGEFVIAVQYV